MANINETPIWRDGVLEIATTDEVKGGPDGVINQQASQLADRTAYLKQQVESAGAVAADADTKASTVLERITAVEADVGTAQSAAVLASQHKDAAQIARDAALAAQGDAEAAAALAADKAQAAADALDDVFLKNQQTVAAAASAAASAASVAEGKDYILTARGEVLAAVADVESGAAAAAASVTAATAQANLATSNGAAQVTLAQAQVALAKGQADAAASSASAANTAKSSAEAARDVAILSSGVFANTAAGLAATPNGRYFSVPSSSSSEYLILYLNSSGTAVEQKRYPSLEKLTAIADFEVINRSAISLRPTLRPPATFYKKKETGLNGQAPYSGYIKNTAYPSIYDPGNGVFRAFPNSTIQIVAHGDSITASGGASETYPTRIVRDLYFSRGIKADYRVRGIGGQGFNYIWSGSGVSVNLTDDAPLTIDPTISAYKTNYLIVFAGTNDYKLGGKTPAQIRTYFQTYIAARIAAGWTPANICVCTMLPRENVSETDRSTINANFVADAVTYGYKVAALHSNAQIGAAGQQNNTTYFIDTIHPTDAGQAIIASIIQGVLFP